MPDSGGEGGEEALAPLQFFVSLMAEWCILLNSFLQQLQKDPCHPLRLERGNAKKP